MTETTRVVFTIQQDKNFEQALSCVVVLSKNNNKCQQTVVLFLYGVKFLNITYIFLSSKTHRCLALYGVCCCQKTF